MISWDKRWSLFFLNVCESNVILLNVVAPMQRSLIFADNIIAMSSGALVFPSNIRLGWNLLPMTKSPPYFFVNVSSSNFVLLNVVAPKQHSLILADNIIAMSSGALTFTSDIRLGWNLLLTTNGDLNVNLLNVVAPMQHNLILAENIIAMSSGALALTSNIRLLLNLLLW